MDWTYAYRMNVAIQSDGLIEIQVNPHEHMSTVNPAIANATTTTASRSDRLTIQFPFIL